MTRCPFSSCPAATSEWACTLLTWPISSGSHTPVHLSTSVNQMLCLPAWLALPAVTAAEHDLASVHCTMRSCLSALKQKACFGAGKAVHWTKRPKPGPQVCTWCRRSSPCCRACCVSSSAVSTPVSIQSSCIHHMDWWSVEPNAGQSLVTV